MVGSSGARNKKNHFDSVNKEKLFDKVLTTSDVENFQLVIPNDHALNYFPLFHQDNQDQDFPLYIHDRNNKRRQYSYSYWDCIQMYTITKNWENFVEEWKLKAGDTVSFYGVYIISGDNKPTKTLEKLFIDGSSSTILPPCHPSPGNIIKNYFGSEKKVPLFNKDLTPNDVGVQLVISINYFPRVQDSPDGMMLDFQDRNGKMWRFRCTRKIITKGWPYFVKEKKLEAGDTISFYRDSIPRHDEPEKEVEIFFIDWSSQVDSAGGSSPRSPPAKKRRFDSEVSTASVKIKDKESQQEKLN